jgi:hypothetical protein
MDIRRFVRQLLAYYSAQSQSSGQTADYQIDTPITVTSQSTAPTSFNAWSAFLNGFTFSGPYAPTNYRGPYNYGVFLPPVATLTSVLWSGSGTQAAAEAWAAANGGTTLSLAADATEAEVTAGSANFAAQASGVPVVFQNATQGVPIAGQWAQTEYSILMANPNVPGIMYNLIDNAGVTICTIFCSK